MSGLAAALAGHRTPGVYRWSSAFEADDVRHTVEHADWRFGYVDGWTHQDKPAFLGAVAATLDFPDWFGANYDALFDCLFDLRNPTVLLWDGWSPFARADRKAFDVAVRVFADFAEEGRTPLFTLLRGEGPELDLPDLDHDPQVGSPERGER